MVNPTTVISFLILLGAVCLANAAPAPLPQGDLVILVDAAKLLYDTLSQAIQEEGAQLQQNDTPAPPPLGDNINHALGTAVNGNDNFNFHAEVNGLHLDGK